jgi:hypothetical protein
MACVTNRCLFQGTEPSGWIACTIEALVGEQVAYKAAGGYCSARADGSVILVPTIGINETFTPSGNLASAVIGEGPRVIGVSA